jgi:hypothetical protein
MASGLPAGPFTASTFWVVRPACQAQALDANALLTHTKLGEWYATHIWSVAPVQAWVTMEVRDGAEMQPPGT